MLQNSRSCPSSWPDRAGKRAAESRSGEGEVDEGAVVDDESVGVLADDRGLHAIVEDGARRAADRLEGRDVAAQDALQVLVEDEPRPTSTGSSRAPSRTARRCA